MGCGLRLQCSIWPEEWRWASTIGRTASTAGGLRHSILRLPSLWAASLWLDDLDHRGLIWRRLGTNTRLQLTWLTQFIQCFCVTAINTLFNYFGVCVIHPDSVLRSTLCAHGTCYKPFWWLCAIHQAGSASVALTRSITARVSGRTPRHNKKDSAACSTNMPSPSLQCAAPRLCAHCINAVGFA